MKSFIILFAILMLAMTSVAAVHTVSGDGLADYTSVQPAIDAATAGDTILVYPGGVYAGFNVTKQLIIMGGGIEPQLNKNTKVVGTVTLQSAADFTELRSLWITASPSGGAVVDPAGAVLKILAGCSNVQVWRCLIENNFPAGSSYFAGAFVGVAASVRFLQCAIWASQASSSFSYAVTADTITAITLENCVTARWAYVLSAGGANSASSPLTVRHCIFESFNYFGITGAFSGSVENSVFVNIQTINPSTPNLTFNYNTLMASPGSNFVNFVTYSPQTSDYHLAGGSVLINTGNPSSPLDLDVTTADQGVYGGQHPYVKNGAPDYPFVLEVEVPTSAPAGGVMNVYTRGRIGPGN